MWLRQRWHLWEPCIVQDGVCAVRKACGTPGALPCLLCMVFGLHGMGMGMGLLQIFLSLSCLLDLHFYGTFSHEIPPNFGLERTFYARFAGECWLLCWLAVGDLGEWVCAGFDMCRVTWPTILIWVNIWVLGMDVEGSELAAYSCCSGLRSWSMGVCGIERREKCR